jgi:hypothetical protein
VSFDVDARYRPVVTEGILGVLVLKDEDPTKEATLITANVPVIGEVETGDAEPEPPAPFEFLG